MSRFKIPRAAWFVAGALAIGLLTPSGMTLAKGTLRFAGIEGTSTNKADVTPAGQLLTTEASPTNAFQNGATNVSSAAPTPIAVPPAGSALIVTLVHINTFSDSTPGLGNGVVLLVESGTNCPSLSDQVGTYIGAVNPPTVGETNVALGPGVGVPAGDALCALDTDNVETDGSVSGYTVPSSEVTAGPVHTADLPPRG